MVCRPAVNFYKLGFIGTRTGGKCRFGSFLHLRFWYFVHHRLFLHYFWFLNTTFILITESLGAPLNIASKASTSLPSCHGLYLWRVWHLETHPVLRLVQREEEEALTAMCWKTTLQSLPLSPRSLQDWKASIVLGAWPGAGDGRFQLALGLAPPAKPSAASEVDSLISFSWSHFELRLVTLSNWSLTSQQFDVKTKVSPVWSHRFLPQVYSVLLHSPHVSFIFASSLSSVSFSSSFLTLSPNPTHTLLFFLSWWSRLHPSTLGGRSCPWAGLEGRRNVAPQDLGSGSFFGGHNAGRCSSFLENENVKGEYI